MTDEAPKKKKKTTRSAEARKRRRATYKANRKARGATMSKAEKRQAVRRTRDRRRVAFDDVATTTIFADAGFNGVTKSGSWGVWMKTDGMPSLSKGGPLLSVDTSVEAEMRALANALALARAARFAPDGACVMIQSDCQAALSWVLGALPKNSCHRPAPGGVGVVPTLRIGKALERSAGLRAFVQIATEAGLKIVVRHVRGHKAGDGRQWVNRHVDKLARQNRVRPKKAASEEGETP
jgi:ribonuclease HI